MLIELPNGDWIDPNVVQGVRLLDDRDFGPRIAIDAYGYAAKILILMDDSEAARAWIKNFGAKCNELCRETA